MHEEATAQVVNVLFERLIAINPAFRQCWRTDEDLMATKREWVIAFIDSGINSIEQLKKGLSKVRLDPSPFIPSPGQFIAMCKLEPSDIGAPSLQEAYQEAIKNASPYEKEKQWSHPAVRNAAQRSDMYFLRTEIRERTFRVFEQNYKIALADVACGKNLNQIENQAKDTPDNRMAYQEYYGAQMILKKYSNQERLDVMTYEEWLKRKCIG